MKNITIPQSYKSIIDKISNAAKENGFEVYIVGGFVRDLFIKREPTDLDIMVCGGKFGTDEQLAGINFSKIIAYKYKLRAPIVFERFGTSKLFIDNKEVEFVMPRKEYYEADSRNPNTQPASLKQDALRRDFTINALFLKLPDLKILDFTGHGVKDIKNKIIRVTDAANAEIIFKQDPLRILRALRQSLQLRFRIELKTYNAMKTAAERIKIISAERIRDEINKILIEDYPSKAFKAMREINSLNEILPEISKLKNLKQADGYCADRAFMRAMKTLDRTKNDIILRMAVLLHVDDPAEKHSTSGKDTDASRLSEYNSKNAKEAEIILNRLKYSKEFIQKTVSVIQNSIYSETYSNDWTDGDVRKFAKRCGGELDLTMEFSRTYYSGKNSRAKIAGLKKRIEVLKSKNALYNRPVLTGKEIINIFNKPAGKWVQEAKNKIEEIQLENPELTKEEAAAIAKAALNNK
ncbi:MAG: hypothetical protein LBR09_01805 [Endomicrobium sp.]|jgi:tRNA nucleotidyltransferase/poly(A) polymerase|nr:hypothetical protein [Endomicrobium sp.]